jgi:3-oxoadipate enol-lactonase
VWAHGLLSSMALEDRIGLFRWSSSEEIARVIRYDARGHGDSGATARPTAYRWSSLAVDLLGLLDRLDVDRAVLGGASMGAATAVHAASIDPDRAVGLVLAIPPTAWSTRRRQALAYRAGARVAGAVGPAPLGALARVLPNPRILAAVPTTARAAFTAGFVGADRRVVAAVLRGASQSDLPPPATLRALRVPALVLSWPGDRVHPRATSDALARLLPSAVLHRAVSLDDVRRWPALVHDFVASV